MREDKKFWDVVKRPFLFASCVLAAQISMASPTTRGG